MKYLARLALFVSLLYALYPRIDVIVNSLSIFRITALSSLLFVNIDIQVNTMNIVIALSIILLSSQVVAVEDISDRVANAFSRNIISGMTVLPQELQITTIKVCYRNRLLS